jgi:hypothetical protein
MRLRKIVDLTHADVKTIVTKYIEKKYKTTVTDIEDNNEITDDAVDFSLHLDTTEAPETTE